MPRRSKKNRKKQPGGGKRRAITSSIASGGKDVAAVQCKGRDIPGGNTAARSVRLVALERRAAKDERLETKGICRLGSTNPMLQGLKLPLPLVTVPQNDFTMHVNIFDRNGTPAFRGKSLSSPRHCFLCAYFAILPMLDQIGESDVTNRWTTEFNLIKSGALSDEKTERMATDLLTDIETTLCLSQFNGPDVNGNRIVVIFDAQIELLYARTKSRFFLNQYQGAIEDATEAIWLLKARKCVGNEDRLSQAQKIRSLLLLRASATEMLGDFDGAIFDLRAVFALCRLNWDANDARVAVASEMAIKAILEVHAQRLIALKAARPHFTIKERRKMEKELSLGTCNMTSARHCQVCGVDEAVAGASYRCSGCHGMLVCGKACQAVSWANGHRHECKGNYTHVTMCKSKKNAVEEDIAMEGYSVLKDENYGLRLIFPEAQSGTYFCSFTNKTIIFQWIEEKDLAHK